MPINGVKQVIGNARSENRAQNASIYIKLNMDGWMDIYVYVYIPHNLFKYWTDSREICYKYSLRYGAEHCQQFAFS
jgi:hypothetical protein